MSPDNNTREQLEQDANLLRERIAQNLESLDQRSHEAFDVKAQATRHPLPLVVVGAGSVLALLSSAAVAVYRKRRGRSPMQERLAALKRVWEHPERLASNHPEPIGGEILRRVTIGVVTFVAVHLAKRALIKLIPELEDRSESAR
jgi:hypothetical protein